MRKWGGGYKKRTSGGIVSLFNFGKGASRTGKTLPKFEIKKRCIGVVMRRRKISEGNGRELRRILVKKGY